MNYDLEYGDKKSRRYHTIAYLYAQVNQKLYGHAKQKYQEFEKWVFMIKAIYIIIRYVLSLSIYR